MNKLVIHGLIITCALSLAACGEKTEQHIDNLPWQIEILPDGHSKVFGIELGKSTTLQAKRALDQKADFNLFKSADGNISLEAYYGTLTLGVLEAKLIAEVDATQEQLKKLGEHAENPRAQPSGSWKFDLRDEDYLTIQDWPVRSLTYIPMAVQFDAELLEKRFGKAAERKPIDEGREYWLYPDKGLVIVLDAKGKEILQYVAPSDFARLKDKISREMPRSVVD
ncbi:MAG: hypothetical protein AB1717_01185 [Pseudomonadota bacterium]